MIEKLIPVVVQFEGVFIINIILNESNYVWSQLMEMHIVERKKFSYIRGKVKPPTLQEEGYEKWYVKSQKRWLMLPMKLEIVKRHCPNIWIALLEAF